MATTFSNRGTVDGQRSATTHGTVQALPSGTTRREVLRWLGSVAVAGALGVVGASGRSGSAQAERRGKKRHKRHNDRPQPVTSSAIEAPELVPDEAGSDQDLVGRWCHWQTVCYPNGVCRRRRVCW